MIDHKDLLQSTMDGEPPTALDLDDLIRTFRRRHQRRWWAGGVSTVAGLAVIVLLAVAVLPATQAGPSTPAAAADDNRAEGVGELARTLDEVVPAAIARHAPQLRWTRSRANEVDPFNRTASVVPFWTSRMNGGRPGPFVGPNYSGDGLVQVAARTGRVTVELDRLAVASFACPNVPGGQACAASDRLNLVRPPDAPHIVCPDLAEGQACAVVVGPAGERVRTMTGTWSDPGQSASMFITVTVVRRDGAFVEVSSDNVAGPAVGAGWTGDPPPLTAAQLTGLALDPVLAVDPTLALHLAPTD